MILRNVEILLATQPCHAMPCLGHALENLVAFVEENLLALKKSRLELLSCPVGPVAHSHKYDLLCHLGELQWFLVQSVNLRAPSYGPTKKPANATQKPNWPPGSYFQPIFQELQTHHGETSENPDWNWPEHSPQRNCEMHLQQIFWTSTNDGWWDQKVPWPLLIAIYIFPKLAIGAVTLLLFLVDSIIVIDMTCSFSGVSFRHCFRTRAPSTPPGQPRSTLLVGAGAGAGWASFLGCGLPVLLGSWGTMPCHGPCLPCLHSCFAKWKPIEHQSFDFDLCKSSVAYTYIYSRFLESAWICRWKSKGRSDDFRSWGRRLWRNSLYTYIHGFADGFQGCISLNQGPAKGNCQHWTTLREIKPTLAHIVAEATAAWMLNKEVVASPILLVTVEE